MRPGTTIVIIVLLFAIAAAGVLQLFILAR